MKKTKTSNNKEVFEFTELIQKEKEDALLRFHKEDFRARLNRRIKEESIAPSPSVFWFRKPVIAAGTVLILVILGWIATQIFAPNPYERDARAIEKALAQVFDVHELLVAQRVPQVEPQPGPDNLHEFEWSLKRVVYSAQRENIADSDVPGILSQVLQNTTLLQESEEKGPEGLNPETENGFLFRENNSHQMLYKIKD